MVWQTCWFRFIHTGRELVPIDQWSMFATAVGTRLDFETNFGSSASSFGTTWIANGMTAVLCAQFAGFRDCFLVMPPDSQSRPFEHIVVLAARTT